MTIIKVCDTFACEDVAVLRLWLFFHGAGGWWREGKGRWARVVVVVGVARAGLSKNVAFLFRVTSALLRRGRSVCFSPVPGSTVILTDLYAKKGEGEEKITQIVIGGWSSRKNVCGRLCKHALWAEEALTGREHR